MGALEVELDSAYRRDQVERTCKWFMDSHRDIIKKVMEIEDNQTLDIPEYLSHEDVFVKIIPSGFEYDWFVNYGKEIARRLRGVGGAYPVIGACMISPTLTVEGELSEEDMEMLIFELIANRSLTLFMSDLFPGMTLVEYAENADPMSLREVFVEVVGVAAEVESSGVLHGDIHPRNVMINRGEVALVDFDSSALLEDPSSFYKVPGILPYNLMIYVEETEMKDFASLVFMPPELLALADPSFGRRYEQVQDPVELLDFRELEKVFGKGYMGMLKKAVEGNAPKERPVRALLRSLTS